MRALALSVALLAAAVPGITVTPDIYSVYSKSDFEAEVGQYYPYQDSYGSWAILGRDNVYDSPNDFPEDKTGLTAYVASPVSEFPLMTGDLLLRGDYVYFRHNAGPEGYHWYAVTSESFSSLYYVRCYYYNGTVVPSSTPVPIFRFNGDEGSRAVWSLCVAWPASDPHFTGSDFYVPVLIDTSEFVPSLGDIPGDTAFGLVYNLGQWLNSQANVLADFFNFKIFGYPFYQLLAGVGFMLFVGWTMLRFFVP